MNHQDRAQGSVIGLAVGDAIGTTLEFSKRDSYDHLTDMVGGGPFDLAIGEWTDDTSMALCLGHSLLCNHRLSESDLLNRFYRWYTQGYMSSNGVCFDIGITTVEALNEWASTGSVVNCRNSSQSGNGSIMRLSPAVVAHHSNRACALDVAVRQSMTTHSSCECLSSVELLTHYLFDLYQGHDRLQHRDHWSPKVQAVANQDYETLSRDLVSSSGYVVHTLEASIWCVHHSQSFEQAVLMAANLGNDSDTVAAVTGQIAGAKWGASAIPKKWVDRLSHCDIIVDMAQKLYQKGVQ